ncbi:sensor histidine kinase [Rhizohabitans arisaemae]|uniref:sensor histidine kinase n=1 Tax=Rhizohabitans arisaemae TaxID=2720610 RepID=UPI0024B17925|nr:sensor histidine kinase [Rhizohabitans arisaemae]
MRFLGELRRFLVGQRVPLSDTAVAVALVTTSRPDSGGEESLWWFCSAVMTAALFARHRWPFPAFLAALAGGGAHHLDLFVSLQPVDLIVPITLSALTCRDLPRWVGRAALGLAAAGVYAISLVNLLRPRGRGSKVSLPESFGSKAELGGEWVRVPVTSLTDLLGEAVSLSIGAMFALVLAFAWGEGVRGRNERLLAAHRHAADLEREHRQRTALAVLAERTRLAREMHDVIAHGLSVVVAQAQAAVATRRRSPELSERAMREVVSVARGSLSELRQLLGALRNGSDEDGDRRPPAGVGGLPALADRVSAAGISVDFRVEGDPAALPTGVDLAVYRIVQEALTNVVKHAGPGARADVRLAFASDHVAVEVGDDGVGILRPEEGNGLRGIAERVRMLDGELRIGRDPRGGLSVYARLPVGGEVSP